jgi:hypothetical protein
MTFSEAHEQIDILLDKHEAPWFEPKEKDMFLNFAQNELIKKRYSEFELNEKRKQDLRTLISTKTSTVAGATIELSLVPDLMFVLSLKGRFTVASGGINKDVDKAIRPMQHDDVNIATEDPFNSPSNDDPYYLTFATKLEIKSITIPSSWEITYLKYPIPVDGENSPSVEFELPKHTHEEILNIAIRKILKTIGDDTYSLQINEINEQE